MGVAATFSEFSEWTLLGYVHMLSSTSESKSRLPRGVTSIHNKRGCATLTSKTVPKNPGTYQTLRPKNPGTYPTLRPKSPGTRSTSLSSRVRKLTTQIIESLISTPHLRFIYFINISFLFCDICAKSLNFFNCY